MTNSALPNASAAVTDSIFTWTFRATSGDSWGGLLVEDSTRYVVGSTLGTAHGSYTIVAAAPQGTDLSAFGMDEGWISVGWYRDSTGVWMLTRLGESTAAGFGGLGSEVDAAWTGSGWDSFGRGGADQADVDNLADSLFTWSFTADSGDLVFGTLLGKGSQWAPGDTLRTAHGVYQILTKAPLGQDQAQVGVAGTVHTTRYYDGAARADFVLESGGAGPTGYGGLGSELDRAWTGSAWVLVGQGGALQADRIPDVVLGWTFAARNGDTYSGLLIGHSTAWDVGDQLAMPRGTYTITSETALAGQLHADATVWTTGGYFDHSASRLLPSYSSQVLNGAPSGYAGLGSEYDYAWNGRVWDDFGRAGTVLASVEPSAIFRWRFDARNGDYYTGRVVQSLDTYDAGDIITTPYGAYTIEAEDPWSGPQSFGTVWTYSYFDASANEVMPTYYWTTLGGAPSGGNGLGSEYDYAWDGRAFSEFGLGGAKLANEILSHDFTWRFDGDKAPPGFGPKALVYNNFGAGDSAGGWSSDDRFPRHLADVNGDGRADIVGFGHAGVFVALGDGSGGFGPMALVYTNFGAGDSAGGWSSDNRFPRQLADVNGDGRADLVGFGHAGVYVALANGSGGFGSIALRYDNFGASDNAGGWSNADRFPRQLADLNGDSRADIAGFGDAGMYVVLANDLWT
ncbi:VCBS repeat-containing protein [Falsiroseomonas sp.]|uniref:FG-GAP repeat domain-containing protein n=1 Tax=Falsiroseomonas sp. TaxID=2870721 RepID=UPI0027348A26|nr:VCBS repeat-containing protein [Falsiroseomonas sp.]MDP3414622.1 VCBS repeat-containing protein [Falsiroseomonas sp.]